VYSLGVQADGKILVGGNFSILGGQARDRIGRLNSNGSVDGLFNPGANGSISSLAVQPDGKIVAGGSFTTLGGLPRGTIGRLANDTAALQELKVGEDGRTIQWTRGGGGPAVNLVTFALSSDRISWTDLGPADRIRGGWELAVHTLPFREIAYIRARGAYSTGLATGSGSVVESVRQIYIGERKIYWPMFLPAITSNGSP
jgi:hypothetical protein